MPSLACCSEEKDGAPVLFIIIVGAQLVLDL